MLSTVLLIPSEWPMWQSSAGLDAPQTPSDHDWLSSWGAVSHVTWLWPWMLPGITLVPVLTVTLSLMSLRKWCVFSFWISFHISCAFWKLIFRWLDSGGSKGFFLLHDLLLHNRFLLDVKSPTCLKFTNLKNFFQELNAKSLNLLCYILSYVAIILLAVLYLNVCFKLPKLQRK